MIKVPAMTSAPGKLKPIQSCDVSKMAHMLQTADIAEILVASEPSEIA